jgi:6-phosphofructokinase 1
VIVAEGVGGAIEISNQIQEKTGIESRATILGHIQRGGSPTVYDRVMASMMGVKAVELLKDNIINRIVSLKDNKVVDIEINEALEMKKYMDEKIIQMSKILAL